ncbi:hypothetical protein EVAR_19593_1 [Eumeta japonica]|uniref:Uncharacterized protein n=1 Tax=Eumeta variegata TaxID=151549 RepID=A0A4C1UGK4_EUMVA|nr:hypothetical protein EVAR_19593_1 [Eumeta japonica]
MTAIEKCAWEEFVCFCRSDILPKRLSIHWRRLWDHDCRWAAVTTYTVVARLLVSPSGREMSTDELISAGSAGRAGRADTRPFRRCETIRLIRYSWNSKFHYCGPTLLKL